MCDIVTTLHIISTADLFMFVYLTGEFGTVYSADLLIKGKMQDVAVKRLNGK